MRALKALISGASCALVIFYRHAKALGSHDDSDAPAYAAATHDSRDWAQGATSPRPDEDRHTLSEGIEVVQVSRRASHDEGDVSHVDIDWRRLEVKELCKQDGNKDKSGDLTLDAIHFRSSTRSSPSALLIAALLLLVVRSLRLVRISRRSTFIRRRSATSLAAHERDCTQDDAQPDVEFRDHQSGMHVLITIAILSKTLKALGDELRRDLHCKRRHCSHRGRLGLHTLDEAVQGNPT